MSLRQNINDYLKNRKNYRAIHLKVLLYMAWKNLISKKLRTALTISGVVIGITAIFFLLSFGLGIQQLVTKQVVGDRSLKSIDINTPNSKVLKLNEEFVNKVKSYPHVDKVGTEYSFPGAISYKGGEIDSVVYGINDDYQKLLTLNLTSGRLLKSDDNKAILINKSALDTIGLKDKPVDQKLTITIPLKNSSQKAQQIKEEFTIVGVVDSGAGSEIFMPDHVFSLAGVTTYQQVKVVADKNDNVASLRKQIESNGFQTTSLGDTLVEMNRIFKFFNVILVSFGSIGMVVSILGMFNTLTISLLERTKEIGLMITLGGRPSDMRKLFILEAVVISIVGAIIGIIGAVMIGRLVNIVMNGFAAHRGVTERFNLFSTPMWAIGAIVLMTTVVGLVVVYFPARRAEKISPIDALRRE